LRFCLYCLYRVWRGPNGLYARTRLGVFDYLVPCYSRNIQGLRPEDFLKCFLNHILARVIWNTAKNAPTHSHHFIPQLGEDLLRCVPISLHSVVKQLNFATNVAAGRPGE
jgi:hypothetical protein